MGSINKKPLCKKTTTCTCTTLRVYPLSKNATKHRSYDKRDFQPNIILDEIRNILRDPKMKDRNSTFLINLGIHYTLGINFTTYQKLIDEVLVILCNRKELGSNAKIVWKTITTMRKELEKPNGNSMMWRFVSEPVSNLSSVPQNRGKRGWELTIRVNKNWLQLMKVDENWWKLMRIDERWWELLRVDESWWELLRVVESWWKLRKVDESW